MKEYNVYIDESGDEGINRGSKFFILTAILVDKEKDLEVSKKVDFIKDSIGINIKAQLHWTKIKGYHDKINILKQISLMDITIINVIVDTSKIRFINSSDIYNYFSGYLYERICWFVKDKNAIANFYVSSRSENLTLENLAEFLRNNKKIKIDYSKIKNIKIVANSQKKLLQIADSCCSALGQALNYNNETHFKYIGYIKEKLYKNKSTYIGYGLKYVPGNTSVASELKRLEKYLSKIKK